MRVEPKTDRRIYVLMRIARNRAIKQGHKPGRWAIYPDGKAAVARCTKCDMPFGVLTSPYPIETAVSGTALAYPCGHYDWWQNRLKEVTDHDRQIRPKQVSGRIERVLQAQRAGERLVYGDRQKGKRVR